MKDKIKEYVGIIQNVFTKVVIPLWLIFALTSIVIFLFIPVLGIIVLFLLLGLFLNLVAGIFAGSYYLYFGYKEKLEGFKVLGTNILLTQALPSAIALFILSLIGVF